MVAYTRKENKMKRLAFCTALVAVVALCQTAWTQAPPVAKWSQPVDTTNPTSWPSETYTTTDSRIADDWKCPDGAIITHVRWWGQYHPYLVNQAGPVAAPTTNAPTAFILRQYNNKAADPADPTSFGQPDGNPIKEIEIPFADCNQTYFQSVKISVDPAPALYIHIFSYEATIALPWAQTKDSIYWLSVQAKFAVAPDWVEFGHWEWLTTPTADFLGTGLSSSDAGQTWTKLSDTDKLNLAFEIMTPAKLIVLPRALTVGQACEVYLGLFEDITQPFALYILADTPAGIYTILLNSSIQRGITPIFKSVPSFKQDYVTTLRPSVKLPAGMKGKTVTFYTVIVQAGSMPPVSKPSDLTPTTEHVILMDKASAVVN